MDSLTAYRLLIQLFTEIVDVPISIEIIPSTLGYENSESNPHYPFLIIEGNLGIPQSILYMAYPVAVQRLSRTGTVSQDIPVDSFDNVANILATTAIIVIANPGHNTALNRRKQLIQRYSPKLQPEEDLKFVAALLGNKEAAKSSLLWHHRRWVFQHMYGRSRLSSQKNATNTLKDVSIPLDILLPEFQLITRASEVYPRNYHAWLHRYLCVQCLISCAKAGAPDAFNALHLELEFSQKWVELHVSDYTAVHYLSRLISSLRDSNLQISFPLSFPSDALNAFTTLFPTSTDVPTISHALSLVASYPAHESLWLYLRLAYARLHGSHPDATRWIYNSILTLQIEEHSKDDSARPPIANALVREILYRSRVEDLGCVRKHALRFCTWTWLLKDKPCNDKALIQCLLAEHEFLAESLERRNAQNFFLSNPASKA